MRSKVSGLRGLRSSWFSLMTLPLVVGASLLVVSCGNSKTTRLAPAGASIRQQIDPVANLEISETVTFDFGAVFISSSVAQAFVISNTGTLAATNVVLAPLVAPFSVDESCLDGLIGPGESCQINVRFTPTLNVVSSGTIDLTYFDGLVDRRITKTLAGRGVTQPVGRISVNRPNPYNFGARIVGTTVEDLLVFTNDGTAPISTFNYSAFTGNFSARPPVPAVPPVATDPLPCLPGTTLAVGASCGIIVAFAPTAPLGAKESASAITYYNGVGSTVLSLVLRGTADYPVPTITFTSNKPAPVYLDEADITWSSMYADSCALSSNVAGEATSSLRSGTLRTKPIVRSARYTLSCTGLGGSTTANLDFTIVCPPDIEMAGRIESTWRPVQSCGGGTSAFCNRQQITCKRTASSAPEDCWNWWNGSGGSANRSAINDGQLRRGYKVFSKTIAGNLYYVGSSGIACSAVRSSSQIIGLPLLQFVDASGNVKPIKTESGASHPTRHSTNALDVVDISGAAKAVLIPANATDIIGSYQDADYGSNSGACTFVIVQRPLCR